MTPLICLVKARLPPLPKGTLRPHNLCFFRTGTFWILQVGNTIEGFGYFMPSIYLPSELHPSPSTKPQRCLYFILMPLLHHTQFPHRKRKLTVGFTAYDSTLLKLSSLHSTLLVSVLNLLSVAGTILIGYLTDHLDPTSVVLISALGSALSVLLIWDFALSTPLIYIFALTCGIFAGRYAATWTGCVSEIQRDAIEAEMGVVLGMMAAGRGLRAVMSGTVSETLLAYGSWSLKGAYGTEYGTLIFFTGITAVLGGAGALSRLRLRGVDEYEIMSTMDIRALHEEPR